MLISLGILIVLIMPFVSAANWDFYQSPLEYLDNEWVSFAIIVLVFFAIIFYTTNKSFNNVPVSAVISGSLALLIAITVLRRGLLFGYAGDELGSWILIIVCLVGLGFLIKLSYEAFGAVGSTVAVFAFWMLLQNSDPYQILPYGVSDNLIYIYEFIASFLGLIILVAIAIFAAPWIEETKGERMIKRLSKGLGFR